MYQCFQEGHNGPAFVKPAASPSPPPAEGSPRSLRVAANSEGYRSGRSLRRILINLVGEDRLKSTENDALCHTQAYK